MTTYTVTAERGTSGVWVFQCVEVPGAISQGRRLTDARRFMPEAIAFVAEVDQADVEIHLVPVLADDLAGEIAAARAAVVELAELQVRAARLSRDVARHLVDEGLTGAETAELLGVSPQRVSQLVAGVR